MRSGDGWCSRSAARASIPGQMATYRVRRISRMTWRPQVRYCDGLCFAIRPGFSFQSAGRTVHGSLLGWPAPRLPYVSADAVRAAGRRRSTVVPA